MTASSVHVLLTIALKLVGAGLPVDICQNYLQPAASQNCTGGFIKELNDVNPHLSDNPCSAINDTTTTKLYYATVTCNIPVGSFVAWVCSSTKATVFSPITLTVWTDKFVIERDLKPLSTCLHINDSVILNVARSLSCDELFTLSFSIKWNNLSSLHNTPFVRYVIYDNHYKPLYFATIRPMIPYYETLKGHRRQKRGTSTHLIAANRLYVHRISLDGSRTNVVVGGLRFAVDVDFHLQTKFLYWTDSSHRAIMRSTFDGNKRSIVLDQGLLKPESLSVDWINNKIYWTDVQGGRIGVLDLLNDRNYKCHLISTDGGFGPRGIVVDPATRILYWTEWSFAGVGRVSKASMDGAGKSILHQTGLQQPCGITLDFHAQVLYWVDMRLHRIESSNVDGSNRRVIIESGTVQPFDLALLGDTLYISDWNLRILATNKSGGHSLLTLSDTFCEYVSTYGIQVIAEERQLLVTNPCESNNGGCSHICVLSSITSRGYSCICPDGLTLSGDGLSCHQGIANFTSTTTINMEGSCNSSGYTDCCVGSMCWGHPSTCFCDSDCYEYGDCCNDIDTTCLHVHNDSVYLLVGNILYIHRISIDGIRNKTLYSSTDRIRAVDFHYRTNHIYWSTTNRNGLWRSQVDGSGGIAILTDNTQIIDDIAIDWISNKLYWTDSGQVKGIRVLDITSGHHVTLLSTGSDSNPRAIVVDPINRWMYWSNLASVTKIERSSMDGRNQTVIHDTGLQLIYAMTLDYMEQCLYWIDEGLDRIETSDVDGSNRRIIVTARLSSPFGLSIDNGVLYFTNNGINKVSINGGTITRIFDDICELAIGIVVVSSERQPVGNNPCQTNNGGCSYLCLLSAASTHGYTCICPDGTELHEDGQTCSESMHTSAPIIPLVEHGTCVAAGYTGGCCTNGTCRGSPPTCFCDSSCHVFQDCCSDVPPSCQPDIDVLEFISIPTNVTIILGIADQEANQFQCSVQASRVTNFEWTFVAKYNQSTVQPITNEEGSLDMKYSVANSDYSSTLTIGNVQFSDTGNYTCIASIGDRIEPITATGVLLVQVSPTSLSIMGSNQHREDDTIQLLCRVNTFPLPRIIWILKSSMKFKLLLATSRISISNSHNIDNRGSFTESELYISNAKSGDSGEYRCLIDSDVFAELTVAVHSISIMLINECEQYPLPCLNGATCIDADQGYYCVCASNFDGRHCSQRINETVTVLPPTIIYLPKQIVSVDFGNLVNLTCKFENGRVHSHVWYKNKVKILGRTESYFYIPEALPEDRANYTCETKSDGSIASNSIQLVVTGVLQYIAVVKFNQTMNMTNQILDYLFLNAHDYIYSVEYLENISLSPTNTSGTTLLVTALADLKGTVQHSEIRNAVSIQLTRIGSVTSFSRFDGCELENQTELDIGEVIMIPCPCQEYTQNLHNEEMAQRVCSGTYASRAYLQEVDFSHCITVTNDTTNRLCQAALDVSVFPLEASNSVVNITLDHQLSSVVDITLLSVIIELLTDKTFSNISVRDNYLRIIDYFHGIDTAALTTTQMLTNSSSRVLRSLDQFMFGVEVDPQSSHYTLHSFGFILMDIIASSFIGQTFNVFKIELSNITESNNITLWNLTVVDGEGINEAADNLVATIHVPGNSVHECLLSSTFRVAYFAFFKNSLFYSPHLKQEITSIIISARLNCSFNMPLITPIDLRLVANSPLEEHTRESAGCASWFEGPWSTQPCRVTSREKQIECKCYQLSYYGLLHDRADLLRTIQVQVYTYCSLVISSIFLLFTFITCVGVRRLRSSLQGLILGHVVLTLMLAYVFFITGAHALSIPILCGISSGLLSGFLLAFLCWTATLALWLYLTVGQVCGLSKQLATLLTIMSWSLPFFIVVMTAGVWHKYYYTSYYCGVIEQPLWFGLILPIVIISIIHLTIITSLFVKLVRMKHLIGSQEGISVRKKLSTCISNTVLRKAIVFSLMSFVCYAGWIVGILSVNPLLQEQNRPLQALFSVLATAQGTFIFIYIVSDNRDAQKFWTSKIPFCKYKQCRYHCTMSNTVEKKSSTPAIVEHSNPQKNNITERKKTESREQNSANSVPLAIVTTDVPTDTNTAYHTVMMKVRKEKYDVTKNEAYGQLGTPRFTIYENIQL